MSERQGSLVRRFLDRNYREECRKIDCNKYVFPWSTPTYPFCCSSCAKAGKNEKTGKVTPRELFSDQDY